jgi:hypothetical protein
MSGHGIAVPSDGLFRRKLTVMGMDDYGGGKLSDWSVRSTHRRTS